MAITQEQQKQIIGLTVSMLGVAPGADYLNELSGVYEQNGEIGDVASYLFTTDQFNAEYDGLETRQEKIDVALNNLGIEKGTDAYDVASTHFNARVDQGVSDLGILLEAAEYLYVGDDVDPALVDVAQQFENRIDVASYYSIDKGLSSTDLDDLRAVIDGVTEDPESVDAAKSDIDDIEQDEDTGVPGETFGLTVGTDNLEGTADNDTFDASIGQNDAGQIVNTLSSADKIDGGAGNDTLNASLSAEVNLAGNELNVQPTTRDVENINIEARSGGGDAENPAGTVNLDAKNMVGVDTFGSDYSDGDLIIQNVNTLDGEGGIRNTGDITVRMDHTSNFDSIGDASDLTVLFDDDYLISGEETKNSLQLRIVNAYELAENDSPLTDFGSVDFTVGGENVSVDITEVETYQDVADAINAELNERGIEGVEASLADSRTAVFTDDVDGYEQGATAGSYLPVNIVSTTGDLKQGPIKRASDVTDFDGLNTWVAGDSQTTDDPVSVNVELEKVGRAGEGGNLEIGGKSQVEVDGQANGIEVFNIDVLGDASKPSSLGSITSTNDQLETINIATGADFAGTDSVADLTVRGYDQATGEDAYNPFGDNVSTVNATEFEGDLTIGTTDQEGSYAQNVNLNADGALGDVEFNASYDAIEDDDANEGDDADAAGTITTGDGDDTINLIGEGNVVVNAGAGDNTVTLSSESTASNTIVVDEAFGTNNINNFEEGTEGDVLDLTAYLDSMEEATDPDSEESEQRIETTVDTDDDELSANEVNVKSYTGTDDVSFDDLNADNLLETFEFTAAQNNAVIDGNGSAVVMVENGDSAGEYKMFNVSFDSSDASSDGYDLSAGDVELIGTTNFGESVDFDAANFA